MSAKTEIAWADSTVNFWQGCTKVSAGCAHCYAEDRNRRFAGGANWGPGAPRSRVKGGIKLALSLNRKPHICDHCGQGFAVPQFHHCLDGIATDLSFHRRRVFCNSLSDWLDDEAPLELLAEALDTIRMTPNLDWLLLTKRPENWQDRIERVISETELDPWFWLREWVEKGKPVPNIWIGTTAENQDTLDERLKPLLEIPARVRFLSCEPLLGPLNLRLNCSYHQLQNDHTVGKNLIGNSLHWIITGGESGKLARPMHPDWPRSLRDQCTEAGVPFFFKQWGEWCPCNLDHGFFNSLMPQNGILPCGTPVTWIGWDKQMACPSSHGLQHPVMAIARKGKKKTGNLLDGREWNEFPNS